ncbi:hypothetical protein HQ531_04590 [bacterium]|nr:hypothetical protein [bacterium]
MSKGRGLVTGISAILTTILGLSSCEVASTAAPEWSKHLVIYEIATKGFTSPNGPESGTFNSLKAKLPYLEDLGINAIWLTGHSYSDSSHFYGIWTQYACIEPGKLDPSLGSEAEFKAMVAEAHKRGIRVFLDTIEHGVMSYSKLLNEHPDWFKGGSWGMTDYDWAGEHPDLDEWWIQLWTDAVLDWGVDGFRCDMGLHRPDLWQEIKQRCSNAGKPIFILGESGNESVSHSCQRDIMLYSIREGRLDDHAALNHLAAIEDLRFGQFSGQSAVFNCEIKYGDDTLTLSNNPENEIYIEYLGLQEDVIGRWEYEKDDDPDWNWILYGVDPDRAFDHIRIFSPERSWHWQTEGSGWKLAVAKVENGLQISGGDPLPGERLRVIAPSCHDCGWDGFPLDKNPYTVQGSRHVFGYGTLLAPAIPLFMSGEEFDAQYVPLPRHTPGLFGEGDPGSGRWLYGSWLQWDQLERPDNQAMFKDVSRLLSIRAEHQDLIHALDRDDQNLRFRSAKVSSGSDLPVPYILTNAKRALLIAGNPNATSKAMILDLSVSDLGFNVDVKKFKITHLWPEEQSAELVQATDLLKFKLILPADGVKGGGLQVVRFEPIY